MKLAPAFACILFAALAGAAEVDYAKGRQWWAFQPVAVTEPPAARDKAWAKSPVDAYILARLESQHLAPAPSADKRALIRRATFDLIGLPPTLPEVDAFLADESSDAFAKVVDRLLASPQYGERWARHWLDVVRYTDSFDSRVLGNADASKMDVTEAWRYRDWVVEAFNADLPYTEFVQRQIAGDLMEGENGVIATGMYAVGNWGGGDSDKEKLLTDIADDQVDVTSRAFLGLTMACARCHDHKFDPVSAKDYYAMAGFFFSSHILENVGPKTNGPPMLRVPLGKDGDRARKADLAKKADEAEQQAAALAKAELAAFVAAQVKEKQADGTPGTHPAVVARWREVKESAGFALMSEPVKSMAGKAGLDGLHNAKKEGTPAVTANATPATAVFSTIKLPAGELSLHPGPKNGVAAAWVSPVKARVDIAGSVSDVDGNCGDGVAWKLRRRGGAVLQELVAGEIGNGGGKSPFSAKAIEVEAGERIELAILPRGEYTCDSTSVDLTIATEGKTWQLVKEVVPNLHGRDAKLWEFYELTPETGLAALRDNPAKLAEAVANPESEFWKPLAANLELFSAPGREQITALRAQAKTLRDQANAPAAFANGLIEGGVPGSPHAGVHDVKVHKRGRYDNLGDLVPRGFPAVLPGGGAAAIEPGKSGRRELAVWITRADNPLTARVMVNRLWQHHFGAGLVRTPDNFGKLGEKPSHAELLDFLAAQFVEKGWSIKAMHRLIMLSATYQQSSRPSAETLAADPGNLLFGRQNRRRLDAEQLRDALLMAGGRLDSTRGGPSINDLNTPRRTLYVMTNRSDRTTYRTLFDAADPTAIVGQRSNSTVAPQSLFFMNHPFVLSRAKELAARVPLEAGSDATAWLYRELLHRAPTAFEREVGAQALAAEATPGFTPLERYCQALLCTNEFSYVD